MAYKDTLPQTNLEAVDIRDTIGCPSNNLAHYCVKAKNGGEGGYAFKIVENGGAPSGGYLIKGSVPYFNMYANNTPAEWVVDEFRNAVCRLRRNIYGSVEVSGKGLFDAASYCFDLGAYRGYVHKAKAPHLFSFSGAATPIETGQYRIVLGFFVPGDYNWNRLAPDINQSDLYYSIDSPDVRIPHDDSTMTPYSEAALHFGISVAWIGNRPPSSIKAKLGLYKKRDANNYLLIGYIPMEKSESGNTGGEIEVSAPSIIQPTPQPMAVTSVVISKLIGHPYMSMLNGYTVGEAENWREGSNIRYRIRWKPDLPINHGYDLTGYVEYRGIICSATVGMSMGKHITEAEAGGGLNVGDPTWIFSGSVDVKDLVALIPRPESLTLKVQNVLYDNSNQ